MFRGKYRERCVAVKRFRRRQMSVEDIQDIRLELEGRSIQSLGVTSRSPAFTIKVYPGCTEYTPCSVRREPLARSE